MMYIPELDWEGFQVGPLSARGKFDMVTAYLTGVMSGLLALALVRIRGVRRKAVSNFLTTLTSNNLVKGLNP